MRAGKVTHALYVPTLVFTRTAAAPARGYENQLTKMPRDVNRQAAALSAVLAPFPRLPLFPCDDVIPFAAFAGRAALSVPELRAGGGVLLEGNQSCFIKAADGSRFITQHRDFKCCDSPTCIKKEKLNQDGQQGSRRGQ